MMHKNVAYNGLRFFVVIRVGGEGFRVVETRSAMCTELHRSEGIFFNTKINKNISMGIGNGLGYAALTISVPLHATPYALHY